MWLPCMKDVTSLFSEMSDALVPLPPRTFSLALCYPCFAVCISVCVCVKGPCCGCTTKILPYRCGIKGVKMYGRGPSKGDLQVYPYRQHYNSSLLARLKVES